MSLKWTDVSEGQTFMGVARGARLLTRERHIVTVTDPSDDGQWIRTVHDGAPDLTHIDSVARIMDAQRIEPETFLMVRLYNASEDARPITTVERYPSTQWPLSGYQNALGAAREFSRDYQGYIVGLELWDNTHRQPTGHYRATVARYCRGERVG